MANNETTTKFKVDISELKSAMQQAKRQISIANSEFKEAASSMDDWSKSSDGISAKLKQLSSNLKSQKSILANLEQQYEAVVKEQGEGSAAADRLRVSINNQKATINNTERQISKYEASLKEVSEAEKIAKRTGKDVADVLDEMAGEAKDADGGFTVLRGTIASFAGNVLSNLVSGLKDAASNMINLAAETREYRTEMGKLDAAYTSNGHSAKTAEKAYNELFSVIGETDQSVEAAQQISLLADSEKEVTKWSNLAAGVVGKFGDALQPEMFYESANETLKLGEATGGYTQMLEGCGYSVEKFNEGLAKCKTTEEKQAYMLKITDQLLGKTGEAYKKNNADVIAAQKANADYEATLGELGAKMEPVTTTVKQGFTDILKEVLKLVKGADLEEWTEKIKNGFAYVKDTILPAVINGFKFLGGAISGVVKAIDFLSPVLVALGVALGGLAIVGFIQNFALIAAAVKGWMMSTKLMTAAQWLLNAAMAANPITLVVIAIAALVAAFVVLWKKSDAFREFFINLWKKIQDFTGKAVEIIKGFFTETIPQAIDKMISFFKQLPSKVWTWLLNTINKVSTWSNNMRAKAKDAAVKFINATVNYIKELPSKVWTWLVNTVNKVITWRNNMRAKAIEAITGFITTVVNYLKQLPSKTWAWLLNAANKVVSWGSNLASKGKQAASKLLTAVVSKAKEIPSKIKSIGADLVSGLWNGITNKTTWLKNKIKSWVGNVKDWLKKFFKIGSPSKLMETEIGRWLPEGIAVGVTKNAKSLFTAMKNLTAGTLGSARSGLASAGGGLRTTGGGGVVNNFTQVINSPKQLSRVDIYRQSKNLLGFVGGN